MTADDIIRMARKARLGVSMSHYGEEPRVWIGGGDWLDELTRFAALVAAEERARIRAEAKDLLDQPSTLFGKWVKMDNVLWIIDGKDASHE